MTNAELEFLWKIWNVGKTWHAERYTGEKVRARTREGILLKAEKFELRHQ